VSSYFGGVKKLRIYCKDVVVLYAFIVVFVCACVRLGFLTFCDRLTGRVLTCYILVIFCIFQFCLLCFFLVL
jgi:hypothetical protein